MQVDYVYDKLLNLDEDEDVGYKYFRQSGEYLDYMLLSFLKTKGEPYNFSLLKTGEAKEYRENLKGKLNNSFSGILSEQLFIEDGANAEIQHLPRYIDIAEHRHDFFEIVCIVKGRCLHRVEDNEVFMTVGDITVIPPNIRHYLRGEPDCMVFTIKIRKSTFDNVFSVLMKSGTTLAAYFAQTLYSKHYSNFLTFHCGQDAFLQELLLYMLAQESERKRHYNHVIDGLLATFFPYLVQNYEDSIEFAYGDSALNERIIAIENYIRQNYQTATLGSVAEHFYFSPAYLSTLIKKYTGYAFSKILCRIRMEHAADLLIGTDMKVEQVCDSVGYKDTTQFIRSFKKYYGTTPRRFRLGERG